MLSSDEISLPDYYTRLENHDWYFDRSDDPSWYRAGRNNYSLIQNLSKQSEEHRKLFLAYQDYMFTGEPFNTPRKPKPERPK